VRGFQSRFSCDGEVNLSVCALNRTQSLAAILTLITISESMAAIRVTPVPVILKLVEITRGLQACRSVEKQEYSYMNKNHLDALLIFSLLSYYTSTCFGHISSPSSGGRMYIRGK
jgi:hypothetical protein